MSGTIKPFYKNKGDKFNPKNYRPIAIVSCFGKLFTAVLNARLSEFSDEMLLINESLPNHLKIKRIEIVINFPLVGPLFHMENIQISFHHKINKI
jgi:hypothetical protein